MTDQPRFRPLGLGLAITLLAGACLAGEIAPSIDPAAAQAALTAAAAAAAPAAAPMPAAPAGPAAAPSGAPVPAVVTGGGAREYAIDAVHSTVSFSVRHLVSRMSGNFREFGGTLSVDPRDLTTTRGSFSARTASIDTANEKRDGHLRSPDFFDADKWPEITFVITSVVPNGSEGAKVGGDFTMRGVTKQVEFDVRDVAFADMGESGVMGFTGRTVIDRDDYGMTWNKVLDIGGLALGKEVTIDIAVEAKAKLAVPEAAAGQ